MSNIDKFQHAFAYGVLAFFCCLSIRSWGLRKLVLPLSLLICAILGGGLEYIQASHGRTADVYDFLFDMIGAGMGCILVVILTRSAKNRF